METETGNLQERRQHQGFKRKEPFVARNCLKKSSHWPTCAIVDEHAAVYLARPDGTRWKKSREGNSTRMLEGGRPCREIQRHGALSGGAPRTVSGHRETAFCRLWGLNAKRTRKRPSRIGSWRFPPFDAPSCSIVVCFDKSLKTMAPSRI